MEILVLGGTAWIGGALASAALAEGHTVTCLARGGSGGGEVPTGAHLVRGDRTTAAGYAGLAGREFDAVVDVARQPGQVRTALAALGDRVGHWTFVSTGNVYADTATPGADESAALLPAADADEVGPEQYGEGKVACEQAVTAAFGNRALVLRLGLVSGPGDHTGRTGYYVARAARAPSTPMVVPDIGAFPTSCVDVRDVTDWWSRCVVDRTHGTFDVCGPTVPFEEWIALCREVGAHDGPVVALPEQTLLDAGVSPWAGPDSLPLWVGEPGWEGFADRAGTAAVRAGLRHRDRRAMLADVLAWERRQGLDRPRGAGLSPEREAALAR